LRLPDPDHVRDGGREAAGAARRVLAADGLPGSLTAGVGNAAELGIFSALGHIDPATWNEVMDLDLTAGSRSTRAMDPLLRAAPTGRTIFLTSGVARGFPLLGPLRVCRRRRV
jgi:NAD(P)-dependent dehydrogenase (short-subunit alcohol dehydrogenase family)